MTTSRRLTCLRTSSQVEVNLPLNFTGPQKTDHPLAPPIYLHYYQLVQGELIPELGFRVPTPEPPEKVEDDKPKISHSRIGSRGSRKRFSSDESAGKRTRKRWSPEDENVTKTAGKPKSFGKVKKKAFRGEVKRKTPRLSMTRNRSITLFPVSPPKERRGRMGKFNRSPQKPGEFEKAKKFDELKRQTQIGITLKPSWIEKGTERNTKGKLVIGESKEKPRLEDESPLTTNPKPTPTLDTPNVKNNDEPKPIKIEEPAPAVNLVKKLEPKPVIKVNSTAVEVKEEKQAVNSSEKNKESEVVTKNDDISKIVPSEQPKISEIPVKMKNLENSEKAESSEQVEPSKKAKPSDDSEKPEDVDESKLDDDQKMKLERERLTARMNRRRARRKKKRAKEKAGGKSVEGDKSNSKTEDKKTPPESAAGKKQTSGALVDNNSSQIEVSNQTGAMSKQMGMMNNLMGVMNNPMGGINNSMGSMSSPNSPMGGMNNQMGMLFQLMQLSNQGGGGLSNPGQQGQYWEKMLMNLNHLNQRIMMVEGGNRVEQRPSQNWGDRNRGANTHEKKMPERGRRSKSMAAINSLPIVAEPAADKRKKKGHRKYKRGRIKSLSGEMISTTIATSEEMVDKLELMVYFTGGKGQKKVKPLVLIVDKEWSFKKCMRKALAEMQKRPESRTNDDLFWIHSYDVNTKEGIRDIRTDLRVLMGDHRTEHRGSGLNKKPSDYTSSFMNKMWIVPRKEVSLSTILKRSKSVADLSTISENLPFTNLERASTSRIRNQRRLRAKELPH